MFANICFEKKKNRKILVMFIIQHKGAFTNYVYKICLFLTTYLPLFVHIVIKFPIRQTFQTNFKKLNSTPLHSPSNSKKKSILIKLQIMYLGTQLVIPFRYKSIFRQGLWAATAFKGATSSCALIPNVSVHVSNHLGWQELLNKNQGFQVSNSLILYSLNAGT